MKHQHSRLQPSRVACLAAFAAGARDGPAPSPLTQPARSPASPPPRKAPQPGDPPVRRTRGHPRHSRPTDPHSVRWLWPVRAADWTGRGLAFVRLGVGIVGVAARRGEVACMKSRSTTGSARALMQPETAREFSIAVSEIVAQLHRGAIPASAPHASTTEEFLHDLARAHSTRAARGATGRCWRIFSTTATWPSLPAGNFRCRRWRPCTRAPALSSSKPASRRPPR